MGIRFKNDEEKTIYFGIHKGMKDDELVTLYCGDCHGERYIRGFEHVDNGICYRCNGTGGAKKVTVESLREKAVRRHREDLAKKTKNDDLRSKMDAWLEENSALVEAVNNLPEGWGANTAQDIISRIYVPSEKQIALLHKIVDQQKKWDEENKKRETTSTPVPEGSQTIKGKVISYKAVRDSYSYSGGDIMKLTVQDDRGFRVFGSAPKKVLDDVYDAWLQAVGDDKDDYIWDYGPEYYLKDAVENGLVIEFTATITKSNDDELFGFFSRPRKASVVK